MIKSIMKGWNANKMAEGLFLHEIKDRICCC